MAVGTIIAANYLAMARALRASFEQHHPGVAFRTLIIDGEPWNRSLTGVGEVLLPGDLGLPEDDWAQMSATYTVLELATAAKPALLLHLLAGAGTATYLDPDIQVYGPLTDCFAAAARSSIALTPHCLYPVPRDGMETSERTIRLAGTFNLGFVSVGQRARPFLRWWHERLRQDAVVDVADGLFTDQRWVDWVPTLFEHTVLRDPGLNVAYWNAHERDVRRSSAGQLLAGASPLRFFHFSGYDPAAPSELSRYARPRPRVRLTEHPVLQELCADYVAALQRAGHEGYRRLPFGLDRLPDGSVLTARVRRLLREGYRDDDPAVRRLRPHTDPAGLHAWLAEPVRGTLTAPASRWEYALWQERPDLQAAFPDLDAAHAAAFRQWLDADPWVRRERAAGGLGPATVTLARTPAAVANGWSVLAYADAELGVGEAGRRLARAALQIGLPTEVVGVGDTLSRREHRPGFDVRPAPSYANSITCVNADQLQRAWLGVGVDPADRGGARVGLWFWEVDRVPEWLPPVFDLLDEVWVVSEFTRRVLEPVSSCPVQLVRLPVLPRAPTPYTRRVLGLPEDRTVFLCCYDFLSVVRRKNPLDAIRAYTSAFGPDDGAVLVLKSINGGYRERELAQVQHAAGHRPDVLVVDGYLSAGELAGMIELSDCVLSLHRSEGYGLNLVDAMTVGTAVVATGYSGNMSFMDADSAFLVPYEEVEVGPGCEPYPAQAHWAQPDLDAAAGLLRQVFDDPAAAARRGAAGRRKVLADNALDIAGARVRELALNHLMARAT